MTPDLSSAEALAEALAQHLHRWSLAGGADAPLAAEVAQLGRRLSLAIDEGHVCLPPGPPDQVLRNRLLGSGVVGAAEDPGARPLRLDAQGRLYLARHHDYEQRLARRLLRAAAAPVAPVSDEVHVLLKQLFIGGRAAQQRIAVALALQRSLLLISGGPGTGKTTTVVHLLACLLQQQPELRIELAAPTGKAAARLADALRERAAQLPPHLAEKLPRRASTVHRLLGAGPAGFKYDAEHRLPVDLLIVDEASMLDLGLATKLLEAVPDAARIVLLGDKDQLAAVEAGAVFAEASADPGLSDDVRLRVAALCDIEAAALDALLPPDAAGTGPLRDNTVWFTHNFRFGAGSGIGRLAEAVRRGDGDTALQGLRAGGDGSLQWIEDDSAALPAATLKHVAEGYASYLQAVQQNPHDAAAAAAAFDRFRLLCAVREGPRGVQALNRALAEHARERLSALQARDDDDWFIGRPVIVLRNDPMLQLFNGDIGFVLPGVDGAPAVYFSAPDGGLRVFAPQRLPPCDSAFALTVHKAQGSEFDAVLLLLPAPGHRVPSRELVYTAVTRARRKVAVAGSAQLLAQAVATPTRRDSGLPDRLREQASATAGAGPAGYAR